MQAHFEEFVAPGLGGAPLAQWMTATVVAQDSSTKDETGRTLTSSVRIPAEHLEPGPRGARFHVVDFDPASGTLSRPGVVATAYGDPFAGAPDDVLLADPGFRAQNVYAIAARTLATFEAALGRRLGWAFPGHQLFLVPRAFPEANAFYAHEHRAITFGYVPDGPQTALS
ncbi:MAG TPA: hypothetical protein VHF89_16195, partial [Solirubrobacteraceae bacterium]|nr:hypothetical protein [Solirubrobacteraceae bacterium]